MNHAREKSSVLPLNEVSDFVPIATNIQTIREGIQNAANRVGRDPVGIHLVAATKRVSASRLQEAFSANLRIFGESRLQEAQEKRKILGPQEEVVWHFIGRMQRRKLKDIVGQFALLHSVESVEQAVEINAIAEKLGCLQEVLLQVNVTGEVSKSGFSPPELEAGIGKLDKLPHLLVRGLMTIPPFRENTEETRPNFTQLYQLRNRLAQESFTRVRVEELSMGMSHDYQVAIEEGATIVRIGTAIFGDRT
ncbi:MAG: YggS family pyridoxal phosphate-dependent enzyme [Nitrospirales bacterium]|jgi:pyridoxal phosphate enzyme (YggS family)